ncbi:cation efflux protein [Backusella circina FSU 941]|nr:cation efflux protein [Backusella circina FSU 941]
MDHIVITMPTCLLHYSLQNIGKKGTRITIIGLTSNVGLTIAKGAAGWMMNSASLLAEALHSFSDLLSDFVTLYTFKMSRKPADHLYPYGYGKFETVGSVTVSSLLLAGAVGIGFHSFDLLLQTLQTTPTLIAASTTDTAANTVASSAIETHFGHSHNNGVLDPNAAWFALASVLIKEWLYRATIKVGREERSEVLMANAWHHRSDAYSSAVALVAIGMLVKSSIGILKNSMMELMDKGIPQEELNAITAAIQEIKTEQSDLIDFHSVRGRKQGRFNHIDLVLQTSPTLTMSKANELERRVASSIRNRCEHVQDVSIFLQDVNAAKVNTHHPDHHHPDHHHHDHHHHDHHH